MKLIILIYDILNLPWLILIFSSLYVSMLDDGPCASGMPCLPFRLSILAANELYLVIYSRSQHLAFMCRCELVAAVLLYIPLVLLYSPPCSSLTPHFHYEGGKGDLYPLFSIRCCSLTRHIWEAVYERAMTVIGVDLIWSSRFLRGYHVKLHINIAEDAAFTCIW